MLGRSARAEKMFRLIGLISKRDTYPSGKMA
jgi:hypothetical protein